MCLNGRFALSNLLPTSSLPVESCQAFLHASHVFCKAFALATGRLAPLDRSVILWAGHSDVHVQ